MTFLSVLKEDVFLLIGVIIILLFVLLGIYINILVPLTDERAYIKMEINRALSERERQHWKKELRKLYLKYIPIIGKFIK